MVSLLCSSEQQKAIWCFNADAADNHEPLQIIQQAWAAFSGKTVIWEIFDHSSSLDDHPCFADHVLMQKAYYQNRALYWIKGNHTQVICIPVKKLVWDASQQSFWFVPHRSYSAQVPEFRYRIRLAD